MENQNHIHAFTDTVVPATCKEQGYILHRCACGYEFKDHFVPTGAHSFVAQVQTEASCTKPGTELLRCSVCEATETRPIPPKGHTWGKWNLLAVPTCREKGKKSRVCTDCGYEDVYPIKAIGHRYTVLRKCKKGVTEYFCENCGKTVRKKSLIRRILKWSIPVVSVAVLVAAAVIAWPYLKPVYHYNVAKLMMDKKDYTKAYYHLKDCEDYKDSEKLLEDFILICGKRTWYDADGKVKMSIENTYDEAAKQVNFIQYDAKGELEDRAETQYGPHGDTLSVSYDGNGKIDYKCETEYNEAGQKTLVVYYDAKGMTLKIRREYDENGNCIRTTEQDGKGKVTGILKNEFDDHGNVLKSTSYDAKGKVTEESTYKYKYDDRGNTLRQTHYDAKGNLKGKIAWEYDKENRKISETRYGPEGYKECKYTYNSRGDTLAFISYKDGRQDSKVENTYDRFGNNIRSVYYDGDNAVTGRTISSYKDGVLRSAVSYDAHDHLIRKYEYSAYGDLLLEELYDEDGKVKYKTRRSYEYDEHGNSTLTIHYDMDDRVTEKIQKENYQVIYMGD